MARRRLNRPFLAILTVAVALSLAACTNDNDPPAAAGLSARTQKIGGLEVKATPTQLDAQGAVFTVVFDTHTGAPTIDVAANARLTVDGNTWPNAVWSGDGPGGHHRSGTLRFDASGPVRGTAQLTIGGLDAPLAMTWQLTQ
jgi:hypothetical protein